MPPPAAQKVTGAGVLCYVMLHNITMIVVILVINNNNNIVMIVVVMIMMPAAQKVTGAPHSTFCNSLLYTTLHYTTLHYTIPLRRYDRTTKHSTTRV